MMLIESDPPNEKQLLKANSITTKLIPNSTADNLTSANYRHYQMYSQSLNEKKMNSISQYQLSNNVNTNPFLNGGAGSVVNQNNIATTTLNRLNTQNCVLNTNHGTLRPHNQAQLTNGIYAPVGLVGLEVGLDLNDRRNSCCCFNRRCNISRVIAFICGLVVLFLMSLCIVSSNWLTADKYRQGLFQFCVDDGAEMPLPFDLNVQPGCYPGRDTDYIRLAAILCCWILDLLATLMTGFGLCSNNSYKKYALYKFALYIMIGALIVILIALVIYPAFFASEIETSNRQVWEFGWSYGVGWGSCIFLFGAILLLLCDKESEDLYYRERTMIHNPAIREVKA